MEKMIFEEVPFEEIQKGDLILCQWKDDFNDLEIGEVHTVNKNLSYLKIIIWRSMENDVVLFYDERKIFYKLQK